MAKAVHTALLRQKGPWLIRRAQLKHLDLIIASGGVQDAPEGAAIPEPSRKLEVFLDDGKKLLASSFAEALSNYPSLEHGLAVGFKYTATVGGVTAVVWLEKNETPSSSAPVPDTDHQLVVEITPEDLPASQMLFYALLDWTESIQLLQRDRYFERYGGWLVLLALIAWAQVFPSRPASGDYYKAQARELLASSSTAIDQDKAVRLLLSIASDAPVPASAPAQVLVGPEYYRWLLVAIFCSLVTLYLWRSPTTLLGLGRGEARIALWERARTVLIYSIPSLLAAWFVLPPVLRLLGVR